MLKMYNQQQVPQWSGSLVAATAWSFSQLQTGRYNCKQPTGRFSKQKQAIWFEVL